MERAERSSGGYCFNDDRCHAAMESRTSGIAHLLALPCPALDDVPELDTPSTSRSPPLHALPLHSEPQGVLLLAALQDGGAAPAHALAPRLRKVAAAFAALRRQWAYRLAKQAVGAFRARFNPYRQDRARFASGWAAGGGPGRAASDPGGQVPDADSAWPCPTLLAAADGVHGLLRMLSSDLDPPVFADVWRAVALAINQAFYNEVATEALFSPQVRRCG